MSIQFPNLGINLDYVGKSIRIFGFEITFFGLLIAAGMLLGLGFIVLEARRCGEKEIPPEISGYRGGYRVAFAEWAEAGRLPEHRP